MLTGKAKLAGVIGWPVGHSLSPLLHGYWLDKFEIDGAYLPLPVSPDDFSDVFKALPKMGFSGVNITVPHKIQALELCDEVDDAAQKIGAVNTVHIVDGKLYGSNTDGFGFIENLKDHVDLKPITEKPAMVLGAGGAARPIVYSLLKSGVPEIRITNRTKEKAEDIADAFGPKVVVVDWADRTTVLSDIGLLANTTSLGMVGQKPLEMPLDNLAQDTLVTDIVYVPLTTPLLEDAHSRGFRFVDGLGMLLHQARPGFELWFGQKVDVDNGLRSKMIKHQFGETNSS